MVFYFLLYLYYYNARKNKPPQKGEINMKAYQKIEALLDEYYKTFKH